IIEHIGPTQCAAMGSDNTGNVRVPWTKILEKYPWIINFRDSQHAFDNTIKEILQLPEFQEVIKSGWAAIRFFSKSSRANAKLAIIRAQKGISCGLEKIGKTCFGTIYYGLHAIERCLPAICQLVTQNDVHLKVCKQLIMYTDIIVPLSHAIECGSSSHSTAADIGLPSLPHSRTYFHDQRQKLESPVSWLTKS
ncbi:hypothetical protein K439DRAFT_1357619, partial [Ramaria rubella]